MKFILEIDMKGGQMSPQGVREILRDVAWDIQRNGLLGVGEVATIPDKDVLENAKAGSWSVTDGPGLAEAVVLLTVIRDHLEGGYPGSLIFAEDETAVQVIQKFLRDLR
jgi:hypothetical protein